MKYVLLLVLMGCGSVESSTDADAPPPVKVPGSTCVPDEGGYSCYDLTNICTVGVGGGCYCDGDNINTQNALCDQTLAYAAAQK